MQGLTSLLATVRYYITMGQAPCPRAQKKLSVLLASRSSLDPETWYSHYCETSQISKHVLDFAYAFFGTVLKLDFGRIRPEDHFVRDLNFPSAVWNDWDLELAESFERRFLVDVLKNSSISRASTVLELLRELTNCAGQAERTAG
jgi:hypothetical protein